MTTDEPSADPDLWRALRDDHSDLVGRGIEAAVQTGLFGTPLTRIEVDRFVVLSTIGAGGMGVVYAAYDPKLDRKVALKILGAEKLTRPEEVLSEARALARVTHPNVVGVYDAGTHAGGLYVAMEFVDGMTLRRWLEGPNRTWSDISSVFIAAGHGLAAVNAAGLVHRDFKPENVLIDPEGRARVADFGLARLSSDAGARLDSTAEVDEASQTTGGRGGTPAYMAPEQLVGGAIDAKADQFAFCVSLHEAVFGRRPFCAPDVKGLLRAIERGRPAAERPRGIPSRLDAILDRGLQFDPVDRYPSMPALLADLQRNNTRRRIALGATIIACASAVGGWSVAYLRPAAAESEPCASAHHALDGVWDEAMRDRFARIEAEALGGPIAAATIRHALDRYAAKWTQARVDACQATAVRHEQSPTRLDLRMRCLDRRRDALGAAVELLAAQSPGVSTRGAQWVEALPDLETCANVDVLEAVTPLADDAAVRARVAEVRGDLARAAALRGLGDYEASVPISADLRSRAEAIGYEPLQAEVELALGLTDFARGDLQSAAQSIERALWSAEATRHDEVAARASTVLVKVVGADQARVARGLAWADHARAANRRLGVADGMTSRLAHALFAVHAAAGNIDEALAAAQDELAHAEKPFARAAAHSSLGSAWKKAGAPAKSVEAQLRALRELEVLLGPEHPSVGGVHTNVANVLADLGEFESSIEHHRRALAISRTALQTGHFRIGRQLANLGSTLAEAGRLDEAETTQTEALAILREALGPKHPELALYQGNLANLCLRRGQTARAREYFRDSLRLMDEAGLGSSTDTVGLLEGLASSLVLDGRDAEAAHHLRLALQRARGPGIDTGDLEFALGRALYSSGEAQEGLGHVQAAVATLSATSGDNDEELARARAWLAEHAGG